MDESQVGSKQILAGESEDPLRPLLPSHRIDSHADAQIACHPDPLCGEVVNVGEAPLRHAQGQHVSVIVKPLTLDPGQVVWPLSVPVTRFRWGVGEDRTDSRRLECVNAGVCVPGCAGVVGEVEHRGDPGIEGSEGIDEGACIGVFWSISDRKCVAQTQIDGKFDVRQHSP